MSGTTRDEDLRFRFGKNWQRFLSTVNEDRVRASEASLRWSNGGESFEGKRVLDIGSGSGLFSLAAVRLGATVTAFDYDRDSVACGEELRRRYAVPPERWRLEQGSALDETYVRSLGTFDLVYSWGVLHHTGDMWRAIDLATIPVAPGGRFVIAIYNDQGAWSSRWKAVKKLYNTGRLGQAGVIGVFVPYFAVSGAVYDVLARKLPTRRYRDHAKERGMSLVHDWIDWLGGYPFEVAKPEVVLDFVRQRGFELERMRLVGPEIGCNEFVFVRKR